MPTAHLPSAHRRSESAIAQAILRHTEVNTRKIQFVAVAALLLIAATSITSASTAPLANQKIDDGLGDLPHYSRWIDPTGRDPLGREVVRVSEARR